ncbi:hypothetical protein CFOLD11_40330 [Clostridium folliculivorans]|uniref:Camelysin metallo-endopeptidase n=1 Tax=Clostridium folliculivorans TaxID=2886038 RepID=A0A9W5Y5T9_9CLOT|nr:hypothetical protein [Clostridium folliculivorans]GKU27206.1 hypothetical protein CFOLD11_40330 [Clostridium folliculivorans]
MTKNKKFIIILLGLACIITSSTYTFSYFAVNQKVENSIDISLGNVSSSFMKADGTTKCSDAIVNINGLIPNGSKSSDFYIKNTGTLTSKLALSLEDFQGSGKDTLLSYLDYKITIDSKVYEGNLKQNFIDSKSRYIQLLDDKNQPLLLKSGDKIKVNAVFSLKGNAPYCTEGKNLSFTINAYATQPNDPQWLSSN